MALDELAHVSGADLGGGGGGMFLPGYAGGAAQIPLCQVTVEALPKFDR